jgi:hypothetical protein
MSTAVSIWPINRGSATAGSHCRTACLAEASGKNRRGPALAHHRVSACLLGGCSDMELPLGIPMWVVYLLVAYPALAWEVLRPEDPGGFLAHASVATVQRDATRVAVAAATWTGIVFAIQYGAPLVASKSFTAGLDQVPPRPRSAGGLRICRGPFELCALCSADGAYLTGRVGPTVCRPRLSSATDSASSLPPCACHGCTPAPPWSWARRYSCRPSGPGSMCGTLAWTR